LGLGSDRRISASQQDLLIKVYKIPFPLEQSTSINNKNGIVFHSNDDFDYHGPCSYYGM
jgi:hypothetical protein